MIPALKIRTACCLLALAPALASAETAYVIDRIEVGLHVENDIESPIQKLVGTGTELEVLQRGDDFSQVETLSGETGWINSAYLIDEKPGTIFENTTDSVLQTELESAKSEIENLRNQLATTDDTEASEQIKTMRLKIGELQAELTQLRIDNDSQENNDELYERISRVEQEKIELQGIIDELNNPGDETSIKQYLANLFSKRNLLYFLSILIAGAIIGISIFDLISRRRHGGFRI